MRSKARKRGERKGASTGAGSSAVAAAKRSRVARARRRQPSTSRLGRLPSLSDLDDKGQGCEGPPPPHQPREGKGEAAVPHKRSLKGKVKKALLRKARRGKDKVDHSPRVRPGPEPEVKAASPKRRVTHGPWRMAALMVILLLSLAALLWTYTGTGVLNVRNVEVRGNARLDAAYLRALSGITPHTHLLKMDVGAVEEALLSEPYIASASISRRFPATVILEIKEREPQGIIYQNTQYYLVDQQGMILEGLGGKPQGMVEIKGVEVPLLLPGQVIGGKEFAAVSALLGSMPPSLKQITTNVGSSGSDGLYIESRGTRVIYGEVCDLSLKNTIASLALMGLVDHYGAVEYIDVSFPEHPVIKPAFSERSESLD